MKTFTDSSGGEMIRIHRTLTIAGLSVLATTALGGVAPAAEQGCTPWLYFDPVTKEQTVLCLAATTDRPPVTTTGPRHLIQVEGSGRHRPRPSPDVAIRPASDAPGQP